MSVSSKRKSLVRLLSRHHSSVEIKHVTIRTPHHVHVLYAMSILSVRANVAHGVIRTGPTHTSVAVRDQYLKELHDMAAMHLLRIEISLAWLGKAVARPCSVTAGAV